MKELIKKRYLQISVRMFCMILVLLPVKANAMDMSRHKDISIEWLKYQAEQKKPDDSDNIRELCDALAILKLEDVHTSMKTIEDKVALNEKYNIDELCHLAWGTNDSKWIDIIRDNQNLDGGYGLDKEYESDPYDTLLVMMTLLYQKELGGIQETDEIQSIKKYICSQINDDGGIGYSIHDKSRIDLTAELGIAMLELGITDDEIYKKFDAYLQSEYKFELNEDNYKEQAEITRYMIRRDNIEDVDQIEKLYLDIQKDDGSVYGKIPETIQLILLLRDVEKYNLLKPEVKNLDVKCNTYVLEVGEEQVVNADVSYSYKCRKQTLVKLYYVLTEDGQVIDEKQIGRMLLKGDHKDEPDQVGFSVLPEKNKSYKLTIMVEYDDNENNEGGEILSDKEVAFNLHEDIVEDIVLDANTVSGEDYGVSLSWNDISNDNHRYGYRVFRKTDNGEWETRSTWDGEEKVRVLNVYPNYGRYLKTWMNTPLANSDEMASRGVLDVDDVYFNDYNNDPEGYLKDEDGNYKYDVIMIGSSDCNDGWDLSENSYEATRAFTESGRGILFGHDSVVDNPAQVHRFLAKFADKLGIYYYGVGGEDVGGSCVEVINEGFLTSYPWKLSGDLNIPYAHTSGQYVDSTLSHPATKWLRFKGYDEDADAYLFSRDQYAMIQTGHSNGMATDDERKILANTLFYLKQYTNDTNAMDKSFYDENAPRINSISELQDDNTVKLEAQDYGTVYQYYVEAVGTNEDDRYSSNIVSAEAISGIKGFIVGVSDDDKLMPELVTKNDDGSFEKDIITATDGSAVYELAEILPGETKYIHVYAVDWAGNVSEETIDLIMADEPKHDYGYYDLSSALIATDEDITINCNSAKIAGNVYGKSAFSFQGTSLELDGTAATAGTLSLAGAWFDIKDKQEGIEAQDIPDYLETIMSDMDGEEIEEITAYNSTEIRVPTMCKKTTGAWCSDVGIYANLISDKSISFNANTVRAGASDRVVLCSKKGDITVQATTLTGNGLIYAPDGTVTINVSEFRYTGTIIAKKIRLQMSTCLMNGEGE